jgi:UDP-N-acetylglucosamine 2-epimerase
MLECRRRGIPSVGLQHGFIYRHWLNYRHEADEMQPDPAQASDAGFPRPSMTLVFDAYAARHLEEAGRFPPTAVAVTGSARLDSLLASAKQVSDVDIAKIRTDITGAPDGTFLLVVTKFREARRILRALVDAAGELPGVYVAIKTHPAETTDVYAAATQGAPHVRVLPAAAPLAPLLRSASAVVTLNSTVALDAMVLGVPALVIGLPNNLSPFVNLGAMAGAARADEIAPQLRRILYDREFSQQLARGREIFLQRFEIRPDGRAADRGADAVLRFVED